MNCAMATAGLYVCTLTYLYTIVDYFRRFEISMKRPCGIKPHERFILRPYVAKQHIPHLYSEDGSIKDTDLV